MTARASQVLYSKKLDVHCGCGLLPFRQQRASANLNLRNGRTGLILLRTERRAMTMDNLKVNGCRIPDCDRRHYAEAIWLRAIVFALFWMALPVAAHAQSTLAFP